MVKKMVPLKRQCHEICNTCFIKKLHWAPYEQAKTVAQNFSSSRRCSRKFVLHTVVVDYADMVSA